MVATEKPREASAIATTRHGLYSMMLRDFADWPEPTRQAVQGIAAEMQAYGFPRRFAIRVQEYAETEFLARHVRNYLLRHGPDLRQREMFEWVLVQGARWTKLAEGLARGLFEELAREREVAAEGATWAVEEPAAQSNVPAPNVNPEEREGVGEAAGGAIPGASGTTLPCDEPIATEGEGAQP